MHNHGNLIQALIKSIQNHIQTTIIGFKKIVQCHITIIYTKNHHNSLNELNVIPVWTNSHSQVQNPNPKIQMSLNVTKIICMYVFILIQLAIVITSTNPKAQKNSNLGYGLIPLFEWPWAYLRQGGGCWRLEAVLARGGWCGGGLCVEPILMQWKVLIITNTNETSPNNFV